MPGTVSGPADTELRPGGAWSMDPNWNSSIWPLCPAWPWSPDASMSYAHKAISVSSDKDRRRLGAPEALGKTNRKGIAPLGEVWRWTQTTWLPLVHKTPYASLSGSVLSPRSKSHRASHTLKNPFYYTGYYSHFWRLPIRADTHTGTKEHFILAINLSTFSAFLLLILLISLQ